MLNWPLACFGISLLASSLFMSVLWYFQGKWIKASSVDFFWSLGVGIHGLLFCLMLDGNPLRRLMIGIVIGYWSLRLCALVFIRLISLPEDGRYYELATETKDTHTWIMFGFFQVQALAVSIFGMACWLPARNSSELSVFDFIALGLGIFAVSMEILSDWQLTRFRHRKENKGKVCQEGLWYYSRHPNYFFELVHWWVYVLFSVGSFWFWTNSIFPILMTYFILRFTGIPATERQAIRSRGDAYRKYQETTSILIPWFKWK